MSETIYSATVSRVSDEGMQDIAHAVGSFKLANFAAKEGLAEVKDQDGEFRIAFLEVDAEGNEVRKVGVVAGDADTVYLVGRKKIAAERKRLNPAASDADETDSE